MDIRVEENPAAAVAEMLVEAAERGSQIVLTGGSTPKLAYEMAASQGRQLEPGPRSGSATSAAWTRRDGLSNFRMATDALLGRIMRDQRPAVMRMEGELGPDAGAAAYEALVREHLGGAPALGPRAARASGRTRTARRCSRASPRSRSVNGS